MSAFGRFFGRVFGGSQKPAGIAVSGSDVATAPKSSETTDQKPRFIARKRRSKTEDQRYDLAGTGSSDRNHWKPADGLSPNGAHTSDVLYRLRTRSRYETANNGYVGGLIRGRGNDTVGTGPRLQLSFASFVDPEFQRMQIPDAEPARIVEELWHRWWNSVGMTDKLHLIDRSETREGECFAVYDTNPNAIPGTPQLDVRLYEADQCGDAPEGAMPNEYAGIRIDPQNRPTHYFFYAIHPGDNAFRLLFLQSGVGEWVPARNVFHFFDPDRIGQVHGVPALVAGLPLGAVMRRYTMASLGTAELQASIPATLESDMDLPDSDEDNAADGSIQDMEQIPFAHAVMLVTPAGRKAKPFPSTQPAPGYREFKAEVNTELGRGINAPRNISTGSSAEYNFSSGRLDHLPWQTEAKIRRCRRDRMFLNPIFLAWYAEGSLIPGYFPPNLPPLSAWRWKFRWPGFASIDPVKDATANQIKLASGEGTLDDICSEQGRDWEEVLEQQAREYKKRAELGLPQPNQTPVPVANPAVNPATKPDAEDPANV